MIPVAVTIERFGSFREPQRFDFSKGSGLFFMTGRNLKEPRLGRNGAGKSTVWAAITWCLFGKNPDGLKAGDVANWTEPKGASVRFAFEITEGNTWMQYTVERTHSPNTWKLYNGFDAEPIADLTDDSTNPVYAWLRLEFSTWLQCVLMSQGGDMFMDLKPAAKSEVFTEVMGLDKWSVYSKRAADKADAEDKILRGLESDIARLDGRVYALGDTASLLATAEDWDAGRNARIDQAVSKHTNLLKESKRLSEAEIALGVELTKQETTLQAALVIERAEQAEVSKREGLSREHGTLFRIADAAFKLAEREFNAALKDGVCPSCGAQADMPRLRLRMQQASKKADDLFGPSEAADRALKGARERLLRATETGRQRDEERRQGDREQRAARIAWESCERDLDRLEDEAERITNESNPYRAELDKQERELKEAEVQLDQVRDRADVHNERATRMGFWVRGFKDIRLQLIGEALVQLEIEVNSEVTSLGLVGWELSFAVDRETKAGSISRGFTVHVKSPHNTKAVPWDAWSGGETQRLRLAGQMGMSNLIRASTGTTIPLEVWDEPVEGMSEEGVEDLMNALADRARSEQKQIWVVEHRAIGYGGFDGEVTVVKDRNGSRFEWGTQ